MMRRTLLVLALCLLVMGTVVGCKSSQPFGFSSKTPPASASAVQRAAAELPAEAKGLPAERAETSKSNFLTQKLQDATEFFSPRRPPRDEAAPALEVATERASRTPKWLFAGKSLFKNDAAAELPAVPSSRTENGSRQDQASANSQDPRPSVPPLARLSRRPPPDPAPKPPQEALLASSDAAEPQRLEQKSSTPPRDGRGRMDLEQIVKSASSAWRRERTPSLIVQAKDNLQEAPTNSPASGLKFVPPAMGRQWDAARDDSAKVAAADRAEPMGAADQPRATTEGPEADRKEIATGPRRNQLLAKSVAVPKTSDTAAKIGRPAAVDTLATTQWVAKKSTTPAHAPGASSDEVKQPDSAAAAAPEGVVATTFATHRPPTEQPASPAPSTAPAPRQTSEFPLPAVAPRSESSPAPQYVTNPHLRESMAARPQGTSNVQVSPVDPSPSLPRATATTARPGSVPGLQVQPALPSGMNSYQAYYYRGVVGTTTKGQTSPRPQYRPAANPAVPVAATVPVATTVPVAATAPVEETAAMPAEQMAPLVDASSYRGRMMPSEEGTYPSRTAVPASDTPAAGNTWLATYQRLVQSGQAAQPQNPAPSGTSTTHSLRSDP